MSTPIRVPLLNPNEPEAQIARLYVGEGDLLSPGDVICTLETTKSAADLQAPSGGYVVGLETREGQTVLAGDLLCYLAATPDWVPADQAAAPSTEPSPGVPAGLRITNPALAYAQQHGLDLDSLPRGPLVTEAFLAEMTQKSPGISPGEQVYDPGAIIVYGGGGHGKSIIELLQSLDRYQVHGVIDDGMQRDQLVMGVPVLGGGVVLADLYQAGIRQAVNAVGGIGSVLTRIRVFQTLARAGFSCPTVVHPRGFIEPSAGLAEGIQVFAGAYVGSESRIGFGSIINTNAVVSHECEIGEYCNVSPGALLAGGVILGEGTLVGMGVTINLQVRVGAGARIGNGATIKDHVPDGAVVRAGTTWPD